MTTKLFGTKYPAKGDVKKINRLTYIAVMTTGKKETAQREKERHQNSKITSKMVGSIRFYTVWVKR